MNKADEQHISTTESIFFYCKRFDSISAFDRSTLSAYFMRFKKPKLMRLNKTPTPPFLWSQLGNECFSSRVVSWRKMELKIDPAVAASRSIHGQIFNGNRTKGI